MCEYCAQLKHVLTQSSVTACQEFSRPLSATDKPHTCSRCVLYALIHQNTFAHRWDDIQHMLTTTRPQQIHASLNTPPPKHTAPPHDKGEASISAVPPTTTTARTHPTMIVELALTSHTHEAIQQILKATPAANHCTTTHIPHPTWPLTMTQLHSLNCLIQANLTQALPHRVIFITFISQRRPS